MATAADRSVRIRRGIAALMIALPLVVLAASSLAALRPKVRNPHGKFKGECGQCHSAEAWKPARISSEFNHAQYGFALEGAHKTSDCMSCHTSLEFAQAKTQCQSCHEDPHRGEMGADCSRCHGARSFTDRAPMVRAHQLSHFPLTGSHATLACESCHQPAAQGRMQFVGARADCQGCHMDAYRATTTPDHEAGGFPADCQQCHTTLTWSTAKFDHDRSGFPLTGAHRFTACASCHAGGRYDGTPTDCQSCHQADYDGATPNHPAAGFAASACMTCHTTTTWAGAAFDHNATSFPLTGAHRTAACANCHAGGVYNGLSGDCYSCHRTDYDGATPNHPAAGFPASACITCHNTTTWAGATFDHNATRFALTGAHRTAACDRCHTGGVYAGTPMDCYACHRTEYDGATPNHASSGFAPGACITCHNTTTWSGATFDHNATSFPLTGAHRTAACANCHSGGVYNGLSGDCYSCHRTDYDGATPNHVTAGFSPAACVTCHNTTTWAGATFDHNTTSFPLTGAHRTAACAGCHASGVYDGLSADCYSCHRTDYDGATPNHATAGFTPGACVTCHNTTTWSGATFDHDSQWFRIYSGKHRGKWDACTDCHTNSSNYAVYTCLSCHPHSDRTKTDNDHRGENGYSYTSSACYSCHRRV